MDDITRRTPRRERREPDRVAEREIQTEDSRPAYYPPRRNAGSRLLYYLLDILEVLLALRLVLRLLSANAGNSFVSLIYRITDPFVAPFRGIFAPTVSGTAVVEWSTVIAMIVYALAVYAVVKLIDLAASPA